MEAKQKNKGTGKRVIDGKRVYSMNKEAIKKREQRAEKKMENKELFLEANREYAKQYRKLKQDKKKDKDNRELGDVNNINGKLHDVINIRTDEAVQNALKEFERILRKIQTDCTINTEIIKLPCAIEKLIQNTRTQILENETIEEMSQKMYEVSKNESNDKNRASKDTFLKYFTRMKVIRNHVYKFKKEPIPNDGTKLILRYGSTGDMPLCEYYKSDGLGGLFSLQQTINFPAGYVNSYTYAVRKFGEISRDGSRFCIPIANASYAGLLVFDYNSGSDLYTQGQFVTINYLYSMGTMTMSQNGQFICISGGHNGSYTVFKHNGSSFVATNLQNLNLSTTIFSGMAGTGGNICDNGHLVVVDSNGKVARYSWNGSSYNTTPVVQESIGGVAYWSNGPFLCIDSESADSFIAPGDGKFYNWNGSLYEYSGIDLPTTSPMLPGGIKNKPFVDADYKTGIITRYA